MNKLAHWNPTSGTLQFTVPGIWGTILLSIHFCCHQLTWLSSFFSGSLVYPWVHASRELFYSFLQYVWVRTNQPLQLHPWPKEYSSLHKKIGRFTLWFLDFQHTWRVFKKRHLVVSWNWRSNPGIIWAVFLYMTIPDADDPKGQNSYTSSDQCTSPNTRAYPPNMHHSCTL